MRLPLAHAAVAAVVFASPLVPGAPWIVPDWSGKEPSFPAGSLYFRTDAYRSCPILYRLAIDAGGAVELAAIEGRAAGEFVYLFVNGRPAGRFEGRGPDGTVAFAADLNPHLEPGLNVLVVSAGGEGLTFQGLVEVTGRPEVMFASDPASVKVMKLPPLRILEDEPAMRPGFDDSGWSPVRPGERPGISLSEEALRARARELAAARLAALDEEARWRLQMLAAKGIAIADGEAAGFGGAGRLPEWIRQAARAEGEGPPGHLHHRAEALARLVGARDEAGNLERQAAALAALDAPTAEVEAVRAAARAVRKAASAAEESARAGRFEESAARSREGQAAAAALRKSMILNRPNRCLENKFGWFDSTALLDSDPARWGLRLGGDVEIFASPLSPAALVTVRGAELAIDGWDTIPPIKVYQKPPVTGPVCLWAVLDGREASLRPGAEGMVYEREKHGAPSENWMALVPDLSRGGDLPIELVFLDRPERIVFRAGEKGTEGVRISFAAPGARLLILRPLKEWRGLLEEARVLAGEKLEPSRTRRYLEQFRLWSRAALALPVEFSEAFVRDAGESPALRVADVYEYRELSDFLGTKPLRLALLPPLASYGILVGYPGLEVRGPAKALGSLGIWGDLVAAEGEDRVVYRAPLDAVPRYGGFTAYCFGPTDIGEPGGRREIETVKATGSNSFRPQHNQTGERAIQTVRWCIEQGLQNVFNIDEKWVLDAVEHYRTLARAVKDFPPGAVAYDLLNEPETRPVRAYGALTRKITRAIREIDTTHLIYLEAMPEWGPGAKPFPRSAIENLEATGDPLTVYSFHDYGHRLSARWPSETADVRDLLERWIPAFRFSIDHRAPIHLGEWGGFEQTKESVWDNPCALTMTLDFLDVFESFGWHFHYYSNRGTTRVRKDGSLEESKVQEAFRRHFARGTFNAVRRAPPRPEKQG